MTSFKSLLKQYDYQFPAELIAQKPASPRENARLLLYDRRTRQTQLDIYAHLAKRLPPHSIIVFNQTKVIPARLRLTKPSGGKVAILFLKRQGNLIEVLANRSLAPGLRLSLNKSIHFIVQKRLGSHYVLRPSFSASKIISILSRYGETPVPPYIKHSPLSSGQLKQKYQTVFAKTAGSVAAPTASLHFSRRLLTQLKKAGHKIYFITLHVNLGTFAPLTLKQVNHKMLHFERYEISARTAAALNRAKQQNQSIIAVGTTVVRALESAANAHGTLKKLSGETSLFISPGYHFKFVRSVITNFHVPRSSLMMLVAALIGRQRLLKLYKLAITKKFRLFSFGDGMLIQ